DGGRRPRPPRRRRVAADTGRSGARPSAPGLAPRRRPRRRRGRPDGRVRAPAMTAVSVVVPSLTGDVSPVLASIRRQTLAPAEVEVVVGVRPNGRARNVGVARTTAPVLVFIDDDAVLGNNDALARL